MSGRNSILLQGDVAEAVPALKREDGGDLHVIGSTNLVQTLNKSDLVDPIRFIIDPVVAGGGKRIFHDDETSTTATRRQRNDQQGIGHREVRRIATCSGAS